MDFDSTSTLLCTGSADGSARVWDLDGKCCTNLFRGHSGCVRVVKFNPKNSYELLTTCESYKIKLWNLQTSELVVTFQGHFSAVTSLHFSGDNNSLFSSSRDKVVIVWGLKDHSKRVIPIYECIESMEVVHASSDAINLFSCLENKDEDHVIVAGPSGKISIWNVASGRCVAKNESFYEEAAGGSENNSDDNSGFSKVFMLQSHLVGVTADQTLIFYKPEDLSISHQLVGDNGSILDLKFVGDNHLAMATNTNQLKIFNTVEKSYVLAKGHTDSVMCVDVCDVKGTFYIATGSKDNRVMMWSFDESSSTLCHLSSGVAHVHTITGVCIAPVSNNNRQMISVLSCSNDKTLKIWNYFPEEQALRVLVTTEAHDSDINFVTISPNYEFIATASKDKTAKLWNRSDLRFLGTFKGHKRGVWAAQFSPADKILATASNDLTIMLWDITSFSCLKTFQGHESSVLRVNFLSSGMQLLSCGSDGLMKLWTIKTNECIKTFDAHDDKIWVMATNADGNVVVTGADDGSFTYWKDVTEEEQQEAFAKKQEFTLKEQELMNLLHTKQFGQALELAITLNQPKRTLGILKELIKQQVDVSKQLSSLSDPLLDVLLGYSVAWNQNSKTCMVSQLILNHLLKTKHHSDILKFKNITKVVEGMIPYTERHFSRIKQHLCKASFAECLLQSRGFSANTNFSLPNKCQPEVTCDNGSDGSDMDTN